MISDVPQVDLNDVFAKYPNIMFWKNKGPSGPNNIRHENLRSITVYVSSII
jgi:hypothetical protein